MEGAAWWHSPAASTPSTHSKASSITPLSSIWVGTDVIATLYQGSHLTGGQERFTVADPNLSDNAIGDNTLSSFKVESRCTPNADEVSIYESNWYGGACTRQRVGAYTEGSYRPLLPGTASSVRVGSNVRATLFREPLFGGAGESFIADDPNLSDNIGIGNDTMTTFTVTPRTTECTPNYSEVAIYEHPNFVGTCVVKGIGSYDSWPYFPPLGEDRASSIKVNTGVVATLFEHNGLMGRQQTFTADDTDFGNNVTITNDMMSSFRVSRRPPTVPAPPIGVAATAVSGSAIRVSWTDNSDNETGFQVSDGPASHTVEANVTSYTWTGLAQGTHKCFSVQSHNVVGASPWTPQVCTTTPTVPAVPTGVVATVVSGSQVRVSWTDNSDNETGFQVSDGPASHTVEANVTSYTWTGLAQGTHKCFSVQSHNVVGASPWTPQVCTTTPTVPAVPTGVVATVVSGSQVRVTWSDNSNNEAGFRVSNGATTQEVGPDAVSYVWSGLPHGSTTCFSVHSHNLAGSSAGAGPVCVTTPTVPVGPTVTEGGPISGSEIQVKWIDNSNNEMGFRVSNGTTTIEIGANTNIYVWGGLAQGSTTCLSVRAYNLAGESPLPPGSGHMCVTTPIVPPAPGSVAATAMSGSAIQATWARYGTETGFRVSDGTTTTTVGATTTWYLSSGLAQGTTRCFSVQSFNLAGSSPWTPGVCATTPTVPAAPTGVAATAVSDSEIRVTWADASDNETGFRLVEVHIEQPHESKTEIPSPKADGTRTVAANTTSYLWGGFVPGSTRCFSVQSFNLAGSSPLRAAACTPPPGGDTGGPDV